MGRSIKWPGLPGGSRTSCCVGSVTINIKFSHRGLHRTSKDERTVTTAYLKPDCSNGSYPAEGFCRTGTRRISSWPGEQTLHKQAGYIDADFLSPKTFPLQSDGGPYIEQVPRTELGALLTVIESAAWTIARDPR